MTEKRKASAVGAADGETKTPKRQKVAGDTDAETHETTKEMGLKFIATIKAARDKTGRPIATEFLTLPPRDEIPEYYEAVLLPMAIDTIEEKLHRAVYPTLSALESDVKRMVTNAKNYNDKKSALYEDAERIRKTASNWMVKHNPAYRDPSYQAVATPVPANLMNGNGVGVEKPTPRRPALPSQTPSHPTTIKLRGPQPQPQQTTMSDANGKGDYAGLSFQQAQDKLITDFIKYKESKGGLEIFTPFVNLPSRQLKDYYALIRYPVSLTAVQKRVRGIHGRNQPTYVTDFKSWSALKEEVSYIWRNAREYNEDGSEIYNLASEFEELFKQKLADVKSKVEEPPHPKLKLNMSSASAPSPATAAKSGLKLRLGQKASPVPSSGPATPAGRKSATPGISVDNSALERQQQHVQAGINGQRPPSAGTAGSQPTNRNPFGSSRSGSAVTPIPTLGQNAAERQRSIPANSPPAATNGVKTEAPAGLSPGPNSVRPSSALSPDASGQTSQLGASAMPPPSGLTPRPASGSPHPQAPHTSHYHHPSPYYAPPVADFNIMRTPGKEPLLPIITLSAHPILNLPRLWSLTIPASPMKMQQSVTIILPSTHTYLQIVPNIPVALTSRPYRVFVSINGIRTSEIRHAGQAEKGKPLYEGRLSSGVNRIEVEVIAASATPPPRGSGLPKLENEGVDREKCTLFASVLRG